MNARPNTREFDRVRRDIGARLRIDYEVAEPLPRLLMALLKELEIHVHDAEGERLFAEVDARVAELLRAVGRQPREAHGSEGENADGKVHIVRPPEIRTGQVR